MPVETLLMVPRMLLIANRIHRARRPSVARRAVLAVLRTVIPCCGDCEHPS